MRKYWAFSRFEIDRKVCVSTGCNRWGSYTKIAVTRNEIITNSIMVPIDKGIWSFARAFDSFSGNILAPKILVSAPLRNDHAGSVDNISVVQAPSDNKVQTISEPIVYLSVENIVHSSEKPAPSLIEDLSPLSAPPSVEVIPSYSIHVMGESKLDIKGNELGDLFSQIWKRFVSATNPTLGESLNASLLSKFLCFTAKELCISDALKDSTTSVFPHLTPPVEAIFQELDTSNMALVASLIPIQTEYPVEEGIQEGLFSTRAYHSDLEIFVKEYNIAFLQYFRDQKEFDPDLEPHREWYPDDGIEPDDHLQRWGGPKGLTTALIRNNDWGRIMFERGGVCGSSPPAPRRSLRLARRRHSPSPICSEFSNGSEDIWGF